MLKLLLHNKVVVFILQPRRESQIRYIFYIITHKFKVHLHKFIPIVIFKIILTFVFMQNQNSPRRSKSLKHKNGESCLVKMFLHEVFALQSWTSAAFKSLCCRLGCFCTQFTYTKEAKCRDLLVWCATVKCTQHDKPEPRHL